MRCLIAAACIALASPAFAETEPPTISVSGQASVSAAPDMAEIEAGVTSEAKTARAASEANAKAMNAVLTALKASGIAEKDFQTSQASLHPEMTSRTPTTRAQITGYRATNRVSVKLRDIAKIGSTIDALVEAGANDIGGINFSVSQSSKLLDEARAKAIEDAHRKASIYAKAAGVTLGAPIAISEEGTPPPIAYRRVQRAALDAAPTPIAPGEQTLRVSVHVSYEIKPAAQ